MLAKCTLETKHFGGVSFEVKPQRTFSNFGGRNRPNTTLVDKVSVGKVSGETVLVNIFAENFPAEVFRLKGAGCLLLFSIFVILII